MGNISANSLFHFTGSGENLISILKNGFYPRYCVENADFSFNESLQGFAPTEIAIPMVCFCDIPLSQIGRHSDRYGKYALGLTKQWGERKGINPVMYELPDSNPIKIIRDCLLNTYPHMLGEESKKTGIEDELIKIGNEIMFFIRYIKPYKGKNWNGERFDGEEVKFYDEREWRYIPDYYEMVKQNIKPFIRLDEYVNHLVKEQCNRDIREAFILNFKPEDIKYIIVRQESEVPSMISSIEEMKGRFKKGEHKMLITRILSLDRLNEDF